MAFLNDLMLTSPYTGKLYKVENDLLANSEMGAGPGANSRAVHVCQDRLTVYVANYEANTISKFVNEEYVTDIPVGKGPFGICEDYYGAIYVTCFEDDMVYKLETDTTENTAVTAKIQVEKGPRGICSDSDSNIWVACSLSNSVCRIVGNTCVKPSISLGDDTAFPWGITCDALDNILVANYGTNTVSKINRNRKVLDTELGADRGPQSLVADKDGNIYVGNFSADTISKISIVDGSITEITLPKGSGVTAVGFNSEYDLYAICTLSSKVLKIHAGNIIDTIDVDTNVSGFGDFTGMLSYSMWGSVKEESLTTDQAAVELMKNLTIGLDMTYLKEHTSNYNIKFSSKLVNLDSFDHIKVKTVFADDNYVTEPAVRVDTNEYMITIDNGSGAGTTVDHLDIIGYYDDAERLPVQFRRMDFKNIYNVIIGTMKEDTTPGTYLFVPTVDSVKIVNPDNDSTAFVINPEADGNLVILLSNRIASTVAESITVNGMPISPNWDIVPGTPEDIATQAAIRTIYPDHSVFMDPNISYAGNKSLLVRYKL